MKGSESVRWISGEGDFSAKDDTGAILLLNDNKYIACLNTQAGKVNVFNVQTGRWITKVDLGKPGNVKNDDKILAIWKPSGVDDENLLAVTDKHLISVQIPQGKIVSKITHQNNFKIPKERWD